MSLHERWTYDRDDPAVMLFTAALRAWQLPILPGQRVLELGCNESDFLTLLHRADPSLDLVGVDWRPSDRFSEGHAPEGWRFVQGCAWDRSLFEPASFDWVLLLGALEHFGLGYYGDPRLSTRTLGGHWPTLDAVEGWLKPGGQVYFDVPCNPERAETAHFRTYRSTDDLLPLTLHEKARGWSLPEPQAGTWIPQPVIHRVPYHFVAIWGEKR